ncbi:MAG: hypothetical protein AB1644_07015 [Candidatus Zixiibacteriota bacterium]
MITGSRLPIFVLAAILISLIGCSDKGDNSSGGTSTPTASGDDRTLIQEALTEAITRWHYGDKAVLYDNEFEYLQAKYNFDDYLTFRQIEYAEADTVEAITAQDYTFYNRDSCLVKVEVTFKGPSGKISKDYDKYMLYFHRGRWIRPSVGTIEIQREYDQIRRQADSAAEAEEHESGNG